MITNMRSTIVRSFCLALVLSVAAVGCIKETPEIKVEKIFISQEDLTLTEGETVVLTAEVLPDNATDKTITWQSSDERVVMVSSNGKIAAISVGKAIVTARSGDKSDFITVTVVSKTITVTGVALNKPTVTIEVGESESLTASVTPANATNQNVTWTSSDVKVATVEDGKVSGIKAGSAVITVTTEDGGKTASCMISVIDKAIPAVTVGAERISAVSSVLLGKASVYPAFSSEIKMGFQYSTSDVILLSNSTKVEVSNADAEYNYSAGISGLDPGTVYYYRSYVTQNGQDTYGETKSFTTKELASLILTGSATEVESKSARLNATLDLTDVQYVSIEFGFVWGTSNSNLDTKLVIDNLVNSDYSALLSDLLPKTQYWYKAYVQLDGRTLFGDIATFTTDVVPVTSVSLSNTEHTFHTIGGSITLKATVLPEDAANKEVEWMSSDNEVATVSSSGRVKAIGNGKATITVRTKDNNKVATCAITVAQYVTGILLDKTSLSLLKGKTATLIATVSPNNANDKTLTWTSSDPLVVEVNDSGQVTALSKGMAEITVVANDGSGVSASCDVEVRQSVEFITISKDQISLIEGTEESLTAIPEPIDVDRNLTWTSSNEAVAIVRHSGGIVAKVKGVSAGTATITAAATDGSEVTANCTVTVYPQPVPEKVDLGLSVRWASFNIGSFAPEESGSYFTWGDTEPIGYDSGWSVYKWCNGSDNTLTKYNTLSSYGTVDNKTVLETGADGDDVASKKLGGKWRMPTKEEWEELISECTWTWTSQNGKNGRLVTGKNGNSIFLPAGGEHYGSYISNGGTQGSYWSSSLSVDRPDRAWRIYFGSNGFSTFDYHRPYGRSVRPVYGDPPVHVESVSLNKSSLSLTKGDSERLIATVSPVNASIKSVTWSSSDTSVAEVSSDGIVTAKKVGSSTITATAVDGGASVNCMVTVVPPTPEAIDLGLSVKWASFNIGASDPGEYGDYFAWGETETKSNYNYSTYKWCNGSDKTLTKYNTKASNGTVDNKTELDPEDDVAHVKLGDKWRMPTKSELDELITRCNWTWTTQSGSLGYKVTGPNGKSIFLPAAGIRGGTSLSYAGDDGACWSSSLDVDYPSLAHDLAFPLGNVHRSNYYRCIGQTIRPVYGDPSIHVESVTLSKTILLLTVGQSEQLTATVSPANASIKTVTWSTSNASIATVSSDGVVTAKAVGSTTITATSTDGGASGSCVVTVSPPTPEAVDLGLSVKWANYNVGASAPEDPGDQFAWGETSTKSDYSWSNYRFRISGSTYSDLKFSKYNSSSSYGPVDNKVILDPADDVAHIKWGGNWRMPTQGEFDELKSNCTWEYTKINGAYGLKVTSKKPGYTDKWIFLPAAGRCDGSSLVRTDRGYYWSSSIMVGMSDKAYYQFFNSSDFYITVLERSFGLSVRPVTK